MACCARCSGEMSTFTVFCADCQHPNEPNFKQLLNLVLDHRFQLYRQLSEGGLSTVFAAIDLRTDQTVVVKVSDPRHLAQTSFNSRAELTEARQYWAEMTERMQREVTALVDIHHPHIVKVFAAGSISSDLSYVVMELLRGKTLREELNLRQRLPVKEALAIATEVAAGLSVIHGRGIVHRDLTPRNIFLCTGEVLPGALTPSLPTVKLIDFGIAKFPKPAGAQTYTQHAIMAGTPGYASPEQFQNLAVDHRADIYSLGVMLYEMLTGEKPFTGRTATEIALKQLSHEPTRPRVLLPDLPIRLEALILRALAKEPAIRQQSAEEIIQELKAISSRVEVPLNAPVLTERTEPSGSEVFRLLSTLPANAETIPPVQSLPVEMPVPTGVQEFYAEPASEPSRRPKKFLIATAVLLLLSVGVLFAKYHLSSLPSTSLPENVAMNAKALPTPTIKPDITTPRTTPRPAPAHKSEASELPIKSKLEEITQSPKTIGHTSPRKTPSKAIAIAAKPIPSASSRVSASLPAPRVPVKVEPTPSPAPPPVEPVVAARHENEGWQSEPMPPRPSQNNEGAKAQPTVAPAEPKVISWQGHVQGVREVLLEMPGVPGMVDIPRSFRKKVGIIEPPSPSNGWRRAVLRVFGDGEVSLIVRWWPHHLNIQRQELVRWTPVR